jgi:hypothetical protein
MNTTPRSARLIVLLFIVVMLTSCAAGRGIKLVGPEVQTQRFVYAQDDKGRWFVIVRGQKDFDEAVKSIQPGPASIEKLDLWVITPLKPSH